MIYRKSLLSLFALLFVSVSLSFSFNHPPSTIHHSPFSFTENRGQWDSRVLYKCNTRNGMTWFLERDGVTLLTCVEDKTQPALPVEPSERDLPEMMRRHPVRYPIKSHALKFKFLGTGIQDLGRGGSPCPPAGVSPYAPTVEATGELGWHNNYFLGNDSSKWAPNCRNYMNIVYRDVWEGIDIEWYEENGKLEFDFVVQPGADPNQIRMSCEGLTGEMSLDGFGIQDSGFGEKGKVEVATSLPAHTVAPSDPRNDKSNTGKELKLPTSLGELRTALPQVYQISLGGARSEVDAKFEIENKNEFGITLPNGYQKEHTLRIDPLIGSTYLGGAGDDLGLGVAVDPAGNIIVGGGTNSTNYPTTTGAISPTNNGIEDCFVTKLDSTCSQLLYSTYFGGNEDDYFNSLCGDRQGGVFITGYTFSNDFPYTHLFGAGGSADGFVTHLNSTGSQILYSAIIGGSGQDYFANVVTDSSESVFVTGQTNSTNFPVTTGAYDITPNGGADGFILHLNNAGTTLSYCTYIGGSLTDAVGAGVTDGYGGFIFVGTTNSTDFPATIGAYDRSYNGGWQDIFVAHLNNTGSQLIYSTFLGGSYEEACSGIVKDRNGGVYIAGTTASTDFPVTAGAYDTVQNGGYDCFISHLNATGSELLYSTFLGTTGLDGDCGIVVDTMETCTIAGETTSNNFPTTSNAYDSIFNGGYGGFVAKLNLSTSQLAYSTYIGSTSNDKPAAMANMENGNVVIVGWTSSLHYPTTSSAYDTSYNGGGTDGDCFVSVLSLLPEETAVSLKPDHLPVTFALYQNYPNPFNSSTTISYSLPKPGIAKLELFDLLGRRISTLINTPQNAGVHHVRFDGKNLASGEYFYRLSAGDFQETRKLLLLK